MGKKSSALCLRKACTVEKKKSYHGRCCADLAFLVSAAAHDGPTAVSARPPAAYAVRSNPVGTIACHLKRKAIPWGTPPTPENVS
ncbi:hypothetical protein GUJ93_ZPchr0001g33074 [Zizania palustris]|uniref:Uncharacterized protein n=1 Tax=Zizania palustris TaxID=103762 RepID=A0A8J5VSK2_ZIZPA|nr:hypothetical protein GUJ93_ZPchr0001g33074 [Zizania palustris]